MNQLMVLERNSQRVMTTAVLAEEYGTTKQRISENFNANRERYIEGKHFYCLEGEELRKFKSDTEIPYKLKQAPRLYLWTEKGDFLHAKSLGTDRAWEVYETLVDTYFKVREQQKPLTALEIAKLSIKAVEEVDQKADAINQDLQTFKMDLPLFGVELDKITAAVHIKGVACLDGKESPAYHEKSLRSKVYADIYREIKRQFGVSSYKAIKRNQCDIAVGIIDSYMPPIVIRNEIEAVNAQLFV
ncbi:MAG: ORF6C domain-containing protein [Anaerotignum sp.]|nr:ORF6C domain-containing protein [Anaerotignum sp.]